MVIAPALSFHVILLRLAFVGTCFGSSLMREGSQRSVSPREITRNDCDSEG